MNVRDIIERWPSRADLADDIGERYNTVTLWVFKDSIPGKYDVKLMAAARKRGVFLSYEELAQLRAAA